MLNVFSAVDAAETGAAVPSEFKQPCNGNSRCEDGNDTIHHILVHQIRAVMMDLATLHPDALCREVPCDRKQIEATGLDAHPPAWHSKISPLLI